jgi:hypothetical protein
MKDAFQPSRRRFLAGVTVGLGVFRKMPPMFTDCIGGKESFL